MKRKEESKGSRIQIARAKHGARSSPAAALAMNRFELRRDWLGCCLRKSESRHEGFGRSEPHEEVAPNLVERTVEDATDDGCSGIRSRAGQRFGGLPMLFGNCEGVFPLFLQSFV